MYACIRRFRPLTSDIFSTKTRKKKNRQHACNQMTDLIKHYKKSIFTLKIYGELFSWKRFASAISDFHTFLIQILVLHKTPKGTTRVTEISQLRAGNHSDSNGTEKTMSISKHVIINMLADRHCFLLFYFKYYRHLLG